MAVPNSKETLLFAIDKSFLKLIKYLNSIPLELTVDKTMPGHTKDTQISICNLVAYLIGWNTLVIKWLEHDLKGEPIDFPETGYKWNQLGLLAQKFYQDYQDEDLNSLIEKLELAKKNITLLIASKNNDILYGDAWYGKWTMGRMISLNTSSPYANAYSRLRNWVKEKNIQLAK
ncbi:uncharacterized DUF1706 family protein [Proteus hauseri ATCC 700826]|uniref:Uncharacterized DUF1706 family protein n=1 Tax=Proteus hauseri ATCC 700826 TaxID=1354271 RepID=A0AAJ3HSP2_PROHU|nr:ClbS/DfsB family four-helix bundle protein [Proteus hauseri]OAT47055.1 uncharacterized DUF1706 family protein [Proteus hauseri ATCC 700826]